MLAAIIAALTIAGSAQAPTVAFRTVAHGSDSRIEARYRLVARTAGQWQLIWFKHRGAASAAPQVDVRREMVLAVFAGRQPPGAASVDILTVTREEGASSTRCQSWCALIRASAFE